jgi:hypothetical protein
VSSVHDFPENVFQILVRHHIVFGNVVEEDISTNGEVTIIEVVALGPA